MDDNELELACKSNVSKCSVVLVPSILRPINYTNTQ